MSKKYGQKKCSLTPLSQKALHPLIRMVVYANSVAYTIGWVLRLRESCFFLIIFFLPFLACQPTQPTAPQQLGIYKWKTTFRLPISQRTWLKELGCETLYIKYADIAPDAHTGQPVPYAVLIPSDTTGLYAYKIVPVVFLVNDLFKKVKNEAALNTLARKTAQLIQHVHARLAVATPEEVQFDCDWTLRTRAAYFDFLVKVKKYFPQSQLSATVRLHQYHDPDRTGTPPVDRALLMLYNTGNVDDPNSATPALFSTTDAQPYLRVKRPYTLGLDVALPAFSWALVYRGGTLWKIIGDPAFDLFSDTARFEKVGATQYRVQRGTFVAEQYLRPNDWIMVERADAAMLQQAIGLARTLPQIRRLVLYHADGNAWDSLAQPTVKAHLRTALQPIVH